MTDLTNTLHAGLETAGAGGLLYAITVTGYYVYRGVCARTITTRGCPRNPCHTTRPPTIAVNPIRAASIAPACKKAHRIWLILGLDPTPER